MKMSEQNTKRVRLGEVFDLQIGKTPARANAAYWGGGHKWISIADIGNADLYISDTKETISDLAVQDSGIRPIPTNTLIMSFKLSIGKVAITAEEMYSNEAIMSFRDIGKCEFDLHYLFHQFKNKDWSNGTNKAVMGATLNKATLKNHEILIPPLAEQKRIAGVLDKISAMKRNAEARVQKLDLLVKSRFVEMFGACDKCVPISSTGKISTGSTPPMKCREYYDGNDYCFVKPSDLDYGVVMIKRAESHVSKAAESVARMFDPGAVLVTCIGATIGKMGIARVRGTCNQQINFIEPNEFTDSVYLAYALQSRKSELVAAANATAVPILNKSEFSKFKIPLPPLALQREFAAFVEKVEKLKATAQRECEQVDLLYRAKLQEYFG